MFFEAQIFIGAYDDHHYLCGGALLIMQCHL
jgi:hypothetical protein